MSETVIQLFARPPVAGRVKTRLMASLGADKALAVYRYCLRHSLSLARDSDFDHQLWLTETSRDPLFEGETIHLQQGVDLGQRMYHAMRSALDADNGYRQVILIGSDCIDLCQTLLQRVVARLSSHQLVMVPALDGGYVLIAARESIDPVLFRNIEWGTATVLVQTLERAMRAGIDTFLLNPLRDIDRLEDMQQYAELQQYL